MLRRCMAPTVLIEIGQRVWSAAVITAEDSLSAPRGSSNPERPRDSLTFKVAE